MVLPIVTVGAWLAVTGRMKYRAFWIWITVSALAACSFLPWVLATSNEQGGFPKSDPLLWVPYSLQSLFAGVTFGPSVRELRTMSAVSAVNANWLPVALAIAALSMVLLLGFTYLARRKKLLAAAVALWLFIPMLLAFGMDFALNMNYNVRYIICTFPAIALLVGIVAARARSSAPARLATTLVGLVVCWSMVNALTDPRYGKEDARSAASAIERLPATSTLVVGNSTAIPALRFYGWDCNSPRVLVIPSEAAAQAFAREVSPTPDPTARTYLLTYRPWETDPRGVVRAALGNPLSGRTIGSWPGVTLEVFDGSISLHGTTSPGPLTSCPTWTRSIPQRA